MKKTLLLICAFTSSFVFADIKVTTWNIEHLGSDGRGFGGGFGGGSLPLRTDDQLKEIGNLIENDLQSDVIAFQEVSIDYVDDGVSRSERLDIIVDEMGSEWEYYLPPKHREHADHSMYVEGHVSTHLDAPAVIQKISEEYEEDEKVNIFFVDNTKAFGEARPVKAEDTDDLIKNYERKTLLDFLRKELDQEFQSERLSDTLYEATK